MKGLVIVARGKGRLGAKFGSRAKIQQKGNNTDSHKSTFIRASLNDAYSSNTQMSIMKYI